ncbi:MAG: diaminopimelate decarboxylase [Dehalococcoidales bacterium]|nr:diaminopimelate decarboxylase [Dehalococcoidales bacterium]
MADKNNIPRLAVFPQTADVNKKGNLAIGGCDSVALAEKYGTPLYVFDETDIRSRCREFKEEFGKRYPGTIVSYSPKAFTAGAMFELVAEEGLELDVVSGGELAFALASGFPANRIHFPGNNKSREELELAVRERIGHIVVDNLPELNMLSNIADKRKVDILLRLNPGVDPHTHKHNATGIADSKFGLPKADWDEAVKTAMVEYNLNVDGLHFHIGSGLYEYQPYLNSLDEVLSYAADIKQKYKFKMNLLSIGGGFGAQYTVDAVPPTVASFAEAIIERFNSMCRELELETPKLMIEPGRKIVAQAGVALYTVGVIKEIPGVRTYVSVDGGMGDNIRQPMYGAVQEALVASRPADKDTKKVTISGKYCEAGDVLIKEIKLPELNAGDILAVAGSGAYCVPMSSNYNAALRPAIVFVKDGKARLIRRRETLEDLMIRDKEA